MKHSIRDWVFATRFWSFPVSAMPVIVSVVYLIWKGYEINWVCAAMALVGNVIFHAAGNLLSDYFDFKTGVDNEEAYAVPNLVFHKFEAGEYLRFSSILFSVGIAIGLALTFLSSWKLLIIGGIGAILAASYAFFKYRAMGDIFVFTCFGILPLIGTSLVTTGGVEWDILVLAIPLGILTVAVLHDNNTVDIVSDSKSGIKTMPMILGEKVSVGLFVAFTVLPYISVIAICCAGYLPYWSLLCLASIPAAWKNIATAMQYKEKGISAMIGLDQKTAQLHLVFSLLLAIGIGIAAFI